METIIEVPNRRSWVLIVLFSILTLQVTAAFILMIINLSELPWYQSLMMLTLYSAFLYFLLRGLAWQYKGQWRITLTDKQLTWTESSPMKIQRITLDLDSIDGFHLKDNSQKEGPLAMLQLLGIADRLSVSITSGKKEAILLKGNDVAELTSAKEKMAASKK